MKQRKVTLRILLVCLAVIVLVQSIALVKCELLTSQYYADFAEVYRGNPMLGEMESFKVLNCDGQTAEVYYIESGKTGAYVLSFEKTDGCWAETGWRCIWSTTGSASEVIWPYWWHFIYGGL